MMSQIRCLIVCSLLTLGMIACKKKTFDGPPPIIPATGMLSENEKQIALLNKEIADILKTVYFNDSALLEVNVAILSGYYGDERVLLYDLLFPENSTMYTSGKFSFKGVFARVFFKVMEEGNYPLLREALVRPLHRQTMIVSHEAIIPITNAPAKLILSSAIYFPYSENFSSLQGKKVTIVAATSDADTAKGSVPGICPGLTQFCYSTVMVDDNYAATKPTHIITQGAEMSANNTYPQPVSNMVNRTYNGWSRLTRQMDKLISLTGNGGGSEIKICRINGYLKTKDEQVDNFEGDIVTAYFSRNDIKKGVWKRVYSVWDPNWNYQDIEQVYAVYEEDTKGEATFNGSLTTTVNLPGKPSLGKAVGEVGFKITVHTQDEIITQRKLDRISYFKSAGINQGFGMYPDSNDFLAGNLDWPIYDGGTVWNYTMPFQVY